MLSGQNVRPLRAGNGTLVMAPYDDDSFCWEPITPYPPRDALAPYTRKVLMRGVTVTVSRTAAAL